MRNTSGPCAIAKYSLCIKVALPSLGYPIIQSINIEKNWPNPVMHFAQNDVRRLLFHLVEDQLMHEFHQQHQESLILDH